jgi:hypothetical protein
MDSKIYTYLYVAGKARYGPLPDAFLLGRLASLFGRYNSLFARSGNYRTATRNINNFGPAAGFKTLPGRPVSRYFP